MQKTSPNPVSGLSQPPSLLPPLRPFTYDPPAGALTILHADAHILAVDKPSGLLSVPGKTEPDCVLSRLQETHPDALLVHRLDMATSGVMIFARTPDAQRHLGLQFERRHLSKTYRANVWGELSGSGEIDLPLRCDWPNRPRQMVCHAQGRTALTRWEALSTGAISQMRLHPETGRSHQLRVHMLSLGHPIIGDRIYAHDEAYQASPRLLLHAETLTLRHPDGGAPLTLEAPCPF